jgi:hypothetical protein
MKKQRSFLFLFFMVLAVESFSQGVLITKPRLERDGNNLVIFYDIVAGNSTDQFYVWIEIKNSDGNTIQANALSGDIGPDVKIGNNKKIIWSPEKDFIFLNDEVFVEVKAEKYIKSFNKGSAILQSIALPGWGQTNIRKGKPWWITGLGAYGALAGGYLYHKKYLDSYKSYKAELDPVKRANWLKQTNSEHNISTVLICTAATAWVADLLWVALTPNNYKPIQHAKLSVNSALNHFNKGLAFSLMVDF